MRSDKKTARLAGYIEAIEFARRCGVKWSVIQEALFDDVQIKNTANFRQMFARAKAAREKGLYDPPQLPLPGDDEHQHDKQAQQSKPKQTATRGGLPPAPAPAQRAQQRAMKLPDERKKHHFKPYVEKEL